MDTINLPLDILSSLDLDLRNSTNIKKILGKFSNKIIINCFAYNNVEEAENSKDAFEINHKGVEEIAKFCADNKILLIHFSTDFVFDGKKNLYTESCLANPINNYGKSKLAGEQAIKKFCDKYFIIRTSWLYSHLETKNNFLNKIKTLALKNNQTFYGADDVFGSPTSALSLAAGVNALIQSIEDNNFQNKLFHFSDLGCVSKFNLLKEIINQLNQKYNLSNKVVPVSNSYFKLLAPRPFNTSLNSSLFSNTFDVNQLEWKDSLKQTINLI